MLIFVSGHYPIYGKQVLYFVDPEFAKRAAEPSPQHFYAIDEAKVRRQPPLERTATMLSRVEQLPANATGTDEQTAETPEQSRSRSMARRSRRPRRCYLPQRRTVC